MKLESSIGTVDHGVKPDKSMFKGLSSEEYDLARLAEEHDVTQRLTPHIATLNDVLAKTITDHCASIEMPRVIEVGIGTGATTEAILARQPKLPIIGVDLNDGRLRRAGVRLSPYRDNLSFVHQEAATYLASQEPNTVDCVFSASTLHNLPLNERRKIIMQAIRSLKPGGIFVDADKHGFKDQAIDQLLLQQQLDLIRQNFSDSDDYGARWVDHYMEDYRKDEKREDYLRYLVPLGLEPSILFSYGLEIVVRATKS